ncbi:alpha-amylase family glycosyl hydrolase [Natronosalvus rutilus]|uniref:Alpha-amylase family glycosyl hydrolase n=1 Tax=Natronosalvus rutilus TaxID=2953753 RepID=A0A9E7NB06_9EURY|nr:alpha-amylase family glycosyl hydrolase [Natronosalvus rutilus]UTF53719.1 alpha-amylase family glycosyl hydrolase [Natronosalvus rutilus]
MPRTCISKKDTHGEREQESLTISRRNVVRGAATTGLALAGLGSASTVSAAGERACFQYFHETWPTITDNLWKVADRGYDGIWIQAPQESELTWADQDGRNDPPLGYQPVDFRSFDSEFGTEADLQRLIDTAHDNGLEVYVDCVMNHMAVREHSCPTCGLEVDRDQNASWNILQDGVELVNSDEAEADTESFGCFEAENLGNGLAEVTPAETATAALANGGSFEPLVVSASRVVESGSPSRETGSPSLKERATAVVASE